MEYEEKKGNGYYRVYSDPEYTDFDPFEACYSVEKVREATRESLLALAVEFPERAAEAYEVIKRYHL